MKYFLSECLTIVIFAMMMAMAKAQAGTNDDDGFFFSASGASGSPAVVARIMQGRLQNLLGKDIKVNPFIEKDSRPVKCDKDLDCEFVNRTCRWHNIKNDAGPAYIKDLYVAGGKPNKTGLGIMKSFMFGTDDTPKGQWGLVASRPMNVSKVLFCSDPVPFPEPDPGDQGILKLKSWIMSKSNLKACIRIWDKYNAQNDKKATERKWPMNWLGCSKEIGFEENAGPNELKIDLSNTYSAMQSLAKKYRKPQSELNGITYEVCLIMGPFPGKRGGLMFIDDISWNSGLCRSKTSSRSSDNSKSQSRSNARKNP